MPRQCDTDFCAPIELLRHLPPQRCAAAADNVTGRCVAVKVGRLLCATRYKQRTVITTRRVVLLAVGLRSAPVSVPVRARGAKSGELRGGQREIVRSYAETPYADEGDAPLLCFSSGSSSLRVTVWARMRDTLNKVTQAIAHTGCLDSVFGTPQRTANVQSGATHNMTTRRSL